MRLNGFTSKARNIARGRGWVLGVVLATVVVFATTAVTPLMAGDGPSNGDWPMFGQGLNNNASAGQTSITTGNVGRLAPKWVFTTGGDVSARAAVVDGVAYFPDWGGNLWAVNTDNGKLIWSHQLSDYGLAAGTVSRTSPAVVDGLLYIGTQFNPSGPTGWLLAINAANGNLVWKTQPDTSNSFPVITASPTVANGIVFVGMTSNEEFAAANPSYPCCSVRSSLVALDASTGAKLWETFTVPRGTAAPPFGAATRWWIPTAIQYSLAPETTTAIRLTRLSCMHCRRRPGEGLPFHRRSCGLDCRPRHVYRRCEVGYAVDALEPDVTPRFLRQ